MQIINNQSYNKMGQGKKKIHEHQGNIQNNNNFRVFGLKKKRYHKRLVKKSTFPECKNNYN